MEPFTAVLNNIFLITILVAAFCFIRRQLTKGDFAHRTIKYMFLLAGLLLIVDAIMRLNHSLGLYNDLLCDVMITIGTILLPLLGFLWFLYTCYVTKIVIKRFIIVIVTSVIFVLNGIIAIISVFPDSNIYYSIAEHDFHFGPLYFVYTIILLIPFLVSLVVIFSNWNTMHRRRNPLTFLNFSLIPIIAIIIQYFFAGYSISLMGVVASFIIIVLDIQHQFAVTDFLTGLCNRRNLIKYVELKIRRLRNGDKFAGFMLDINNFKNINDKYGHSFGDKVLIDVANMLIDTTKKQDYLARFGGDEFVLIIDLNSEEEIEEYKNRIRQACQEYNSREGHAHAIDFGIGSALFSKEEGITPTRFLEIIDDRMYIDKQSTKSI
ncbi:MAG: GGDEF domain-containing protein [Bacilli bacterium]